MIFSCSSFFASALLLLLGPGGEGFAALRQIHRHHGIASLKASEPWRTLERAYLPAKDDGGITLPPLDRGTDLYSSSEAMNILSMLIYEYAALRKKARETKDAKLLEALKPPKSARELLPVLKENLHLIGMDEGEVKKRENLVGKFLDSVKTFNMNKVAETIKDVFDAESVALEQYDLEVANSVKAVSAFIEGGGTFEESNQLVHFHDTEEVVKRSCVHAITVNPKLKRVDVIFRGTTNNTWKNIWYDWRTNCSMGWRTIKNPVEGLDDVKALSFHDGFARTLLGGKKEETKNIEKILLEIERYIMQGYTLAVTGHSLGGAVATVFAFFESLDSKITAAGPVMLYTYASPRIGDTRFRRAFKNIEEKGKLRHARIHNKKDQAAKVPPFTFGYKHVGMEMRLREEEPPLLDYPVSLHWKQKRTNAWDLIRDIPDFLNIHSCEEIMKRLKRAKKPLEETSLVGEYHLMWCANVHESDDHYDELCQLGMA